MGQVPGVPVKEIQECAEEVMKTFTPLYAKSYALGLIEKLKMEADAKAAGGGFEWQLKTPPIPSETLKEGWMEKLGEVRRNWKRRYFVATNQADNFRIYYFEKQELKGDPSKKKGEVQPCGYTVKHLDKDEEKKEFGDFALTLKPRGRRRQWFMKCADAEDLKDWLAVLQYSARKADAPLNPDWVMAYAFKRAYEMTRWRLGTWGWYWYDRTEEEMLGQMIVDRCEAGCMRPVYDRIPSGRMERKLREQVQKMLDSTVGAAVATGWMACVVGIEFQKDTIESKARESLGVIFDKQAELKATVQEKILTIISPPLEELTKPIMTPICNCLMAPLVAAYKELAIAYHSRMTRIIADDVKEADLKEFVRETRYWWGPMYPALRHIYKAFRDGWDDDQPETASVSISITVNIGDIIDMLQGVSPWQIESQFEESLRGMMNKAIYTFASELEETKKDPTATLNATMHKLVHDSKQQIRNDITEIFRMVLVPPFKKRVDPLIKDVLEPITGLIPDILKTFLDIEKMASEIMENIVNQLIANCVVPASEPVLKTLDSLPTDLNYS